MIKDIVDNSFPKLKRVSIHVEILKTDDYMAATAYMYPFPIAKIKISKSDFNKMSSEAFTGLIIHELCHIEDDLNLGVKSIFSLNQQSKTERRVDMMVIEKGYGKNLLALMKYHNKHYEKYDKEDGLTRNEIEQLLKD